MKGIAILCIMVGHTCWIPGVRTAIYSFHVPLFFLVSGYFAKTYHEYDGTPCTFLRRNARQLLLPYLIVAGIGWLYSLWQSFLCGDYSLFGHDVVRYLAAMDRTWDHTVFDLWVTPAWFLPALFWARMIFFWLSKSGKWLLPLCATLSIAMILLHPFIPTPFCIGRGIEGLVFMAVGRMYREYRFPLWVKLSAIACWGVSMYLGRIDLCAFEYNCLPIDLIGACGGTLAVWYLSRVIRRTFLSPFFAWCGRHSLIILCAHTIGYEINLVHSALRSMPFKIPETAYYMVKHVVTVGLAWLYTFVKMTATQKNIK